VLDSGVRSADEHRVDALLDPGSPFLELSPLAGHDVYPDPLPGAGLVTGIGKLYLSTNKDVH
jgi:acetyl-CoA carboxylase carboxyltransferase component